MKIYNYLFLKRYIKKYYIQKNSKYLLAMINYCNILFKKILIKELGGFKFKCYFIYFIILKSLDLIINSG